MKLTTAFVFASLAGNAFAEQLHVDVPSAKAPGTAVVRITGDPGRPYQLFYSQVEDMYELPDGNFLFIDPSAQIAAGVDISGVLDASGEALYTFPVKARQAGSKLSFQAISPDPFMQLSNVARATFQKGNTFAFSAGEGGSPSFLGDVFPMANGRLLSVGGSGQMIEQYEPC
ncbi:MAG TPA: hypothetical protein VKE69_09560, partial [Planctomycetota bacterium]|nr:hypothetical protein [Planctomycetota bacterium]